MTARPVLLALGTTLAFGLGALAEPANPDRIPRPEATVRELAAATEDKLDHLEQAARHLDEAGMPDEAARLRERAAPLRAGLREQRRELEQQRQQRAEELRRRELQELVEDAVARLREELKGELRTKGEGRSEPAPRSQREEDERADEYQRQVMRTWQRIEQAGRGERAPEPTADPQPPAPLPPGLTPRTLPQPSGPEGEPGPGQQEILRQILHALQRIEKRLAQLER